MFNQRFIISKRNEVGLVENWNQFYSFPALLLKYTNRGTAILLSKGLQRFHKQYPDPVTRPVGFLEHTFKKTVSVGGYWEDGGTQRSTHTQSLVKAW